MKQCNTNRGILVVSILQTISKMLLRLSFHWSRAGQDSSRVVTFHFALLTIQFLTIQLPLNLWGDDWRRIADVPDPKGIAGAFVGTLEGRLVVAGGANFPLGYPWEGGKKQWQSAIYSIGPGETVWTVEHPLPSPSAYGVCISHSTGLIVIGGSDTDRHLDSVWRVSRKKGELHFEALPNLPHPIANATGCLLRDDVYVLGGQVAPSDGISTREVMRLCLAATDLHWESMAAIPGESRILAMSASDGESLWIVGGAMLQRDSNGKERRKYLSDGFRFRPENGWSAIPSLPHACVGAAATWLDGRFILVGGDDGSRAGLDPQSHPGFSRERLELLADREWISHSDGCPVARVTTSIIPWNSKWVLVSGEVSPGMRSPEVWVWDGHEARTR